MYNQNKTLYNMNIKHLIKISYFATFQQPCKVHHSLWINLNSPLLWKIVMEVFAGFDQKRI